jgi:transposase
MRFVPIKSAEQQALLALHCARSDWVKARTAQVNQIRGLLSEFGIVLPQGITRLRHRLPEILEDGDNGLPWLMRALLSTLQTHLKDLDQQIVALEREIVGWHRRNENSRRLERVPGIGPITATALVASIGNANNFKNGRQGAAWLAVRGVIVPLRLKAAAQLSCLTNQTSVD